MADTSTAKVSTLPISEKKTKDSTDIVKAIRERRSKELIIGICGAIGSGTRELDTALQEYLEDNNYAVEHIKISDIIVRLKNPALVGIANLQAFEKYSNLQIAGNEIRQKLGATRLAEEAIVEIVIKRRKYTATDADGAPHPLEQPESHINTKRVAYIINQLKHPDEVKLFQTVYKNNFYLLGIIRTEKERKNHLEQVGISPSNVDILIHNDKKDSDKFGQQVEKTFHLADYFIRNKNNALNLTNSIERFVRLVHGYNGITPTHDEVGMYTAASASLRSACLSRQVGAAIMNKQGDILSTGCNDVPVAGGGLYTSEFGEKDQRCIFKGKMCYNDHYKKGIKDNFKEILDRELKVLSKVENLTEEEKTALEKVINKTGSLADALLNESRAKSLIEFSRAVHAEMDAIVQLARTEGQTTVGTTLYCTTYPCHSCARHIVAAGISKVIYIEPYEKSLALALHEDAISDTDETGKVSFKPFEGVPPARYSKFFQAQKRKDENGVALTPSPSSSYHVDPQYLDGYNSYEDKVVEKIEGEPPAQVG